MAMNVHEKEIALVSTEKEKKNEFIGNEIKVTDVIQRQEDRSEKMKFKDQLSNMEQYVQLRSWL